MSTKCRRFPTRYCSRPPAFCLCCEHFSRAYRPCCTLRDTFTLHCSLAALAAVQILGWSSGQPAPVCTPAAQPAVFHGSPSPILSSGNTGSTWTRIPTPSPSSYNAFSPALAPLKEGAEARELAPINAGKGRGADNVGQKPAVYESSKGSLPPAEASFAEHGRRQNGKTVS